MAEVPMTIEQRVKEKIKTIIGEIIPEETWDKVAREATQSFLKEDLPKQVKAELAARYKTIIQEELNRPEWQPQWEGARAGTSEMVEEIIKKSAGDVLVSLFGGAVQQIVYNIQQGVQRY
jgi:hypothetical protein